MVNMSTKTSLLTNFCHIIFFIIFVIGSIGECEAVRVFEFGVDDNRPVVAISRGAIGMFEKFTVVPLPVPPCVDVSYVNVGIHNAVSNPQVNYDNNVNVVTISYRWYQYSSSTYSIYAKGFRNPECVLVDDQGPDRIQSV